MAAHTPPLYVDMLTPAEDGSGDALALYGMQRSSVLWQCVQRRTWATLPVAEWARATLRVKFTCRKLAMLHTHKTQS